MNKTKNKHKALNKTESNGGFFKALLFALVSCAVVWLVLSLVFSLVMSKQTDSTAMVGVFSVVIMCLSLVAGGFASAKADKSYAPLAAFVFGCVVLGTCYGLSSVFDFSKDLSNFQKTFLIVGMLVLPVIGAKFATRKKVKKARNRKRL